jgi:hypothetical protein
MNLILWVLFFIVLYMIIRIYAKYYIVQIDNTLMFTGAPGTGKTNEMVKWALKLYKMNTKAVRKHNRWKKDKWEYPILYSNIPIRLNRSEWSTELKKEHLLLTERQNLRSITVITEIGKIASQYDWNNLNVQDNLNDYISLYRQYTQGGFFLCDDQSSDNVAVNIRRRLGTVINMLHFKRWWKIYWVKMRNISVSEDIKTVEEESAEDNMRWRIGLLPLFFPRYDTYAFSERYQTVPKGDLRFFSQYKTNVIMDLPIATRFKNEVYGQKLEKRVTND